MTKTEVIETVRQSVEAEKMGDISFVVDTENVQNGSNWWRVPVRPSHLPEKLFTLYEFLADIEQQIATRAINGEHILLLAGDPLHEEITVTDGN